MVYEKGVKLALITAVVSGLAVFFNRFVASAVGDPLVFTTLKNLGVAGIVGVVLVFRTRKKQIKWRGISRGEWIKLGLIGVVGGSLPFYLFFKGLTLTGSANAALIHKTLVFWVALVAVPVLEERISVKQLAALGLIFSSNFFIGGIKSFSWGSGETMILIATILWAIENIIAKITLKRVPVAIVVGARMILGSGILLLASSLTGKMDLIGGLNPTQWGLTLITVGLLTGYVFSWYRALELAPVTLVATVLCLATLVTNVLSAVWVTHSLNVEVIYQSFLLIVGSWLFIKEFKRCREFSGAPVTLMPRTN